MLLALWQGRARIAGAGVLLAAIAIWSTVERPALLVSQSGGLVGQLADGGRVVSKERGESFSAESWLENDGDPASQVAAFERPGLETKEGIRQISVAGLDILHATGKRAGQRAVGRCAEADVVVVNVRMPRVTGCDVYDSTRLARTGALAFFPTSDGVRVVTARQRQGARLWSQ